MPACLMLASNVVLPGDQGQIFNIAALFYAYKFIKQRRKTTSLLGRGYQASVVVTQLLMAIDFNIGYHYS